MKGKHGQSAAARHAIESRDAEIETYKNAVARLTRERNEARERLSEQALASAKDERVLRARLAEVTSPEVEALRQMLSDIRDENRRLKGFTASVKANFMPVFLRRLGELLLAEGLSVKRIDAIEVDLSTAFHAALDTPVEKLRRRQFLSNSRATDGAR